VAFAGYGDSNPVFKPPLSMKAGYRPGSERKKNVMMRELSRSGAETGERAKAAPIVVVPQKR
jgi:hypothetical protein